MPDMLYGPEHGAGHLIKGTFEYRLKLAPCAEPSAEFNEFCRLFEYTRDVERPERRIAEDRIREISAAVARHFSGAPKAVNFEQELLLTTARDGNFDPLRDWLILSVRPATGGGYLLPIPLPGNREAPPQSARSFEHFRCAPELVCYLPGRAAPVVRVLMNEECLNESLLHAVEASKAISRRGAAYAAQRHPSWVVSEMMTAALQSAPQGAIITSLEPLDTSSRWEARAAGPLGEKIMRFHVRSSGLGIPEVSEQR